MRPLFITLLVLIHSHGTSQELKGHIMDEVTGVSLEYATVKVKGKNLGAVSYQNGEFSIRLPESGRNDTVVFSYIGYRDQLLLLRTVDFSKSYTVKLKPVSQVLKEVEISARSVTAKLGSTKAGNTYTGWGDFQSLRGRMIGVLIDGAECPVKAKSFSFRINHNDWDSVRFRLNFYELKDSQPGASVLQQNIFITTSERHKWVTVDLTRYHVILCKQVVAVLEWVDAWGKTGEYSNMLTLSNARNGGYIFRADPGEETARFTKEGFAPAMHVEVFTSQ